MSDETTADILNRYCDGDEQAAEEIFTRYVDRLSRLARSRLSPKLAARTDPDDVVMSAYRSFFVGARAGKFSLRRSGDLWRLLVSITMHKVYRQARRHQAAVRSVNTELPASGDDFVDKEPSPEQVVAIADELQVLLSRLDPIARRILELRLQDETLATISSVTGRSERTVRRTLNNIREILTRQLAGDANE